MPLLKSAMNNVPEDSDDVEDYSTKLAPEESDLPAILRMADPSERTEIIRRVKEKIKNGVWTGSRLKKRKDGTGGRPTVMVATKKAKQQRDDGKRKTKKRLNNNNDGILYKSCPTVSFQASHCILLDGGYYPTEKRNVASHLCHKNDCVLIEHLVWSNSDDNNRRERKCRMTGQCNCGLNPRCIFGAHKE